MRCELRILLTLVVLLTATACTSSSQVVQPSIRDADLFPGAQRVGRSIVAVDAISEGGNFEASVAQDFVGIGSTTVDMVERHLSGDAIKELAGVRKLLGENRQGRRNGDRCAHRDSA